MSKARACSSSRTCPSYRQQQQALEQIVKSYCRLAELIQPVISPTANNTTQVTAYSSFALLPYELNWYSCSCWLPRQLKSQTSWMPTPWVMIKTTKIPGNSFCPKMFREIFKSLDPKWRWTFHYTRLLLKQGHFFWRKIRSNFWKICLCWQVGIKLSGKEWLLEEREFRSFQSFFTEKAVNTHYHLAWQKFIFPQTVMTVL